MCKQGIHDISSVVREAKKRNVNTSEFKRKREDHRSMSELMMKNLEDVFIFDDQAWSRNS